MQKAVVIGGKGKVGTYLVPMLAKDGFQITNVSRGDSKPFVDHPVWNEVEQLNLDRKDPSFAERILALQADVVIDMICFSSEDMLALTAVLSGKISHYLVAGSIWSHGVSSVVPNTEDEDLDPFDEYGVEKLNMAMMLKKLQATERFPGTIVHPGHIVGPGHPPINPQANQNLQVFQDIIDGKPVTIPNFGLETVHHVHAADVAGVFIAALRRGGLSHGQAFHAVSPRAVTLKGYAQEVASWFGQNGHFVYKPFEEFKKDVKASDADATYGHIARSGNHSMEKARRVLGFSPSYSSYEAIKEAVFWYVDNNRLKLESK